MMHSKEEDGKKFPSISLFDNSLEVADTNVSFDRGSDDWDLYWVDVGSMKELFDHGYFEEHMRINHFRNHYEVSLCDALLFSCASTLIFRFGKTKAHKKRSYGQESQTLQAAN
jgi:hypothetical protein